MSFVPIESFPKWGGLRGTRAAKNYVRAALWFIIAGMPMPALAADAASPAESRSAPQITTPLKALVSEALQNNPEIQAARKEREAAQHRVAPAGALDDPMLEAGFINVPTNSLRFDREDMTMKMIGLSQRLPYPGKRGLRQDVAARDADAVGHGYQETVNRGARDVRMAYFDLSQVIDSTRLVETNKLVLEQFLRIAESRYAVGQGSQADVLKAQTQLSKMTEELIKLARERSMIEADLNRALGRGANAAAPLPESPGLREATLQLDTLHETALRERPQLLALQSIVARNEKALELARKEYNPDFDVRLSYGQRDNALDGMKRSDMVSLTVAINLPVWRDGKLAPRVAEAQAMRERALNMYQAQRNEVAMKLRQQVAAAEQSLRSARIYQTDILPQARLTVESSLAAFRVNRVDFLMLLDSQMNVFNYEISLVAAVSSHNKALAEIELLTGRSAQ